MLIEDIYSEFKTAYSSLEEIKQLNNDLEAKDIYTNGHSARVCEYATLIGKHINLSKEDMKNLRLGSLLHDIGKVAIPNKILLKKGKLTLEEYEVMKQHPVIGANILSKTSAPSDVILIAKHHHEKYDGTGYPDKLENKKIPYLAQIVSVVDAYDAMSSKRAYREELDISKIKEEFENCSGTQFSIELTKVFIDILENDYNKILKIQQKYIEQ
ncbi:MAG: HD-GYP domain-containing protein [Lachnospiraceae bacterium]|jgi:putative nucleotidyltransferase with HDIG domain|nr:HD-GYP domain-containing protein [Lachnospiraceae bacterium]